MPAHHRIEGADQIVRSRYLKRPHAEAERGRNSLRLAQVRNMRRIARITEHRHARKTCNHVLEKLDPFSSEPITSRHSEASKISSGARKTRSQPVRDWVHGQRENDRNRCRRILAGLRGSSSIHHDDIDVRTYKLFGQNIQPLVCTCCVALFDQDVLAFDIAHGAQAVSECIKMFGIWCCLPQKAHASHLR